MKQYPTLWVQDAFIVASGLNSTNTVPAAWEIRGTFRPEEILRAIRLVVDGHESLRTSILVTGDGHFAQRVSGGVGVAPFIGVVDLAHRDDAEAVMSDLMGRLLAHRFDLTTPPLWRGFLATIGRAHWVLGIAFAHVIMDGTSATVFCRDLANALANGARPKPLQLGEIAIEERKLRPTAEQARWWTAQYRRRSGLAASWHGWAHYRVEPIPRLTPELVEGLKHLAQDRGVSISTVLGAATSLGAIGVLGCTSPMLGFATSQRTPKNQSTFGPVHDHLPVLGGDAPVSMPFEAFVRELHLRRDKARRFRDIVGNDGLVRLLPTGILETIARSTPYDVAVNYSPFADPMPHDVGGRGTVTARPIPTIGKVDVQRATSVAPVVAAILRPNRDGSVTGDITAISALHTAGEARALAQAVHAVASYAVRKPRTPIRDLVRLAS